MASSTQELQHWLENLRTLRRELDADAEKTADSGVKELLLLQIASYAALMKKSPLTGDSIPAAVISNTHFMRVTLLVAENATLSEALASLRQLNDTMTSAAERWIRDGVDEDEVARFAADAQAEAARLEELGGNLTPPPR